MRLTGHRVAEPERRFSLKFNLHPAAQTKIPRPGVTPRTCETYWKTKQDIQDRSTDHGGAPQRETMTVTSDIINTNLIGLIIADQTRLSHVVM